jgi:hypothetical protein
MKKLLLLIALIGNNALASNCKVTTVTIENNGVVQAETATVCKDSEMISDRIRKGDIILESEVSKSIMDKYFTYKKQQCRFFVEDVAVKGVIKEFHGVICRVPNSTTNWLVMDKW